MGSAINRRVRPAFIAATLTIGIAPIAALAQTTPPFTSIVFDSVGTTCPSGRTCLTKLPVSSCSGNKNACLRYNVNGTAAAVASFRNTGAVGFGSVGGTVKANANRAFNNNFGTQRPVCFYKGTFFLGSQLKVQFGAWDILPFTGVGSMEAHPRGANVPCGFYWANPG